MSSFWFGFGIGFFVDGGGVFLLTIGGEVFLGGVFLLTIGGGVSLLTINDFYLICFVLVAIAKWIMDIISW